ncbi:hypothetical protein EVAR_20871_1 [Eumeta japonica]|uniref:Uncharacterized protein n=1 Tax=Eumeta variegata TaxID=151549 RepID=A0A4C1UVA5_EUMVA|nr:hypothetical protein EVAR_20871_1 [Eumeta japonica]
MLWTDWARNRSERKKTNLPRFPAAEALCGHDNERACRWRGGVRAAVMGCALAGLGLFLWVRVFSGRLAQNSRSPARAPPDTLSEPQFRA